MNSKLSAVIITFNEERNIQRCIESLLPVADEIIVVDSFSTDRTEEICKLYGIKFFQNVFEGHIEQKNIALLKANHEWILSVDADEALSETLQKAIKKSLEAPQFDAFAMNRLTNYCGKWVKYCGWYPDTKVRLVKKNKAHWTGTNPHDKLELKEKSQVCSLQGDLLHYSYYTKEDHFKQIEYFGNISAKELFLKGKNISVFLLYLKVITQFFKSYFVKMGFLDGKTGWLISSRSAYATLRKYQILRKMYHKNYG
jgi:glycosyltransferase involved in cell wall biosynthesis